MLKRLLPSTLLIASWGALILNAANEAAVEFFLEGKIHFGDIFELVASACETCQSHAVVSLDAILADDQAARTHVEERVMHVSTS